MAKLLWWLHQEVLIKYLAPVQIAAGRDYLDYLAHLSRGKLPRNSVLSPGGYCSQFHSIDESEDKENPSSDQRPELKFGTVMTVTAGFSSCCALRTALGIFSTTSV